MGLFPKGKLQVLPTPTLPFPVFVIVTRLKETAGVPQDKVEVWLVPNDKVPPLALKLGVFVTVKSPPTLKVPLGAVKSPPVKAKAATVAVGGIRTVPELTVKVPDVVKLVAEERFVFPLITKFLKLKVLNPVKAPPEFIVIVGLDPL